MARLHVGSNGSSDAALGAAHCPTKGHRHSLEAIRWAPTGPLHHPAGSVLSNSFTRRKSLQEIHGNPLKNPWFFCIDVTVLPLNKPLIHHLQKCMAWVSAATIAIGSSADHTTAV